MAGLDPAIHDELPRASAIRILLSNLIMDPRVKPAGDKHEFVASDST
jgi:hypothetical protein